MADDKPENQPTQNPSEGDESSGGQFKPLETEPTTRGGKPDSEKAFQPLKTEGIPFSESEQKNIERIIKKEED